MKTQHLILIAVLAAISGCSSTPRPGNYECELRQDPSSKCASMDQAYNGSLGRNPAGVSPSQTVFEENSRARQKVENKGAPVVGQPSGYPDVGEAGMPVFKQPKVLRVWIAPYVDADGNLRSGEYTYFSTPGQWNYGDLKKPGAAASGMFAPSRKDNLGFTPTVVPPKSTVTKPADTPRPPTASVTTQGAAPAQGATAGVPPATTTTATPQITQPYQRLSGD